MAACGLPAFMYEMAWRTSAVSAAAGSGRMGAAAWLQAALFPKMSSQFTSTQSYSGLSAGFA